MGRILIKLATRGRASKFRSVMDNIFKSTKTHDYLVVVSIDNDDAEMMSMLDEINRMPRTACYAASGQGKVAAINRDVSLYIPWTCLVNMSDDFVLFEGWDNVVDKSVKSVWGESTDYFAHFPDGHVNERLPTLSIMGRSYYERFGYIYHPSYKSVSCDAEAYYVALTLYRYHYFPTQIFEHRHPVNVKTGYDATYKANDAFAEYDTENYFRRMKKNFQIPFVTDVPFEKFKR